MVTGVAVVARFARDPWACGPLRRTVPARPGSAGAWEPPRHRCPGRPGWLSEPSARLVGACAARQGATGIPARDLALFGAAASPANNQPATGANGGRKATKIQVSGFCIPTTARPTTASWPEAAGGMAWEECRGRTCATQGRQDRASPGVRPAHSGRRRASRSQGDGAGEGTTQAKHSPRDTHTPGQRCQAPCLHWGRAMALCAGRPDPVRVPRGARCGKSARRDLRGGRQATGVPTSIANKLMRFALILMLCLAEICPASTLLLNPSFEDSDMSPWTRTAISGIRPWAHGSASPQDGSWYVFTVDQASIEQSFGSILGSTITEFSFWIDRPASSMVFVELLFEGGATSGQTDISSVTGSGWGQYDVLPLVAASDNLTGIRVTKLGTGTTRLDNFQLTVVPEPSAGILLGGGLLALLKQRRRTRRRS